MPDDLNESVLPDDYPVFGDYLYVADSKVIRSDWHDVTVGFLKRQLGVTEIRRCDIVGRQRAEAAAPLNMK